MEPHRINVKYFVEDPASVNLPDFIPVFHRWIQEKQVEGLPIDVADYKHVHEGPGILLVGHEGDYAMDMGDGRPGLRYARKRAMSGDLQERLRTVFRLAMHGCALLAGDSSLNGKIQFRADELELSFADRLRTPNESATFDSLRGEIESVVSEIYPDKSVSLEPIQNDARGNLAIRVSLG